MGTQPKRNNARKVGGHKYYEVQALDAKAGTSKLKKKIRDMERLLRNGKFLENNAEKKQETERALEALKSQYEQAQQVNTERDIATMYHKIRFFERKKAQKKVLADAKAYFQYLTERDQAEKESQSSDEKEEALKTKLVNSEIELYYTVLFPRTERYVSLYPSSEKPEDEKVRNKIKEAVKLEIKKLVNVEDLPSGLKVPGEEDEQTQDKDQDKDQDIQDDNDDKKETAQPPKKKNNRPTSYAVGYCDELKSRVIAGEKFVAPEIVQSIRSAHPVKPKTEKPGKKDSDKKKSKKRSASKQEGKKTKKQKTENVAK